jgi:hypothetical protein
MAQQIKLQIPDGFEIDLENSTAEEIALKPIKKQLPKTWEELGEIKGYWVEYESTVENNKVEGGCPCVSDNRNVFATEAQAKASIAMAQLSQLREVYRQGWKPKNYNPNRSEPKYWIGIINHKIVVSESFTLSQFLSFQSQEIAEEFLTNFEELIVEAAPLLFGEEITKQI